MAPSFQGTLESHVSLTHTHQTYWFVCKKTAYKNSSDTAFMYLTVTTCSIPKTNLIYCKWHLNIYLTEKLTFQRGKGNQLNIWIYGNFNYLTRNNQFTDIFSDSSTIYKSNSW
jgi:hypothetical protein